MLAPGSGSKLVILPNPVRLLTAGQPFAPQPSVAIEDQFNNIITSDDSSLVVVTRTFGGALQGTLSATVGKRCRDLCQLERNRSDNADVGFHQRQPDGRSFVFDHSQPGGRRPSDDSTQPSSTVTAGTVFATQPVVQIQDQYNNVVTSDNTSLVTAVRSSGSGTLQGTTTVTASSGVATFANLFHTVAGNITILFSSGSLTTTVSEFDPG